MANTQPEQVDIVNEKGDILGQTSKEEAHKKGLLHMTVISEVVNSKGQWLLVKQASDRQDAGQYVSPVGGHVRAGESLEDALKREAMEELGIENYTYTYLGRQVFNREVLGRKENHLFVLYEMRSDQTPVLNEESVSYRLFTTEELKRELKNNPDSFGDAFHFVVKSFFSKILLSVDPV